MGSIWVIGRRIYDDFRHLRQITRLQGLQVTLDARPDQKKLRVVSMLDDTEKAEIGKNPNGTIRPFLYDILKGRLAC
jgi:hypothetical protein